MTYKKFRLYPEHKTLFFEVGIYDSRKKMLAAIKRETVAKIPSDTMAYTDCVDVVEFERKNKRLTRKVGKMYFFKNGLDPDIISHEVLHAINGYFARQGFLSLELTTGLASDLEEVFACCLGRVVGDFFRKAGL